MEHMRHVVLSLAVLLAACSPMNGSLTVRIQDTAPPLHDVYLVMRDNGYPMKKPQSIETYPEETWNTEGGGATGAFMDPAFKRLVVIVMQFKDDPILRVFFDESPTGFSAEGQARTDKLIAALKTRLGDKVVVTDRRNYKGAH
jgi:hypothetical protein